MLDEQARSGALQTLLQISGLCISGLEERYMSVIALLACTSGVVGSSDSRDFWEPLLHMLHVKTAVGS
jgi:hypothetical protein